MHTGIVHPVKKINVDKEMASSKKNIADKKNYAINPFFFRDADNKKEIEKNRTILDRFESVHRFYTSLEGSETSYRMNVKDCYALKLAGAIIERISTGDVAVEMECAFDEDFYLFLAKSVPADDTINDSDLVVIYLKQMMNIMKRSGVVSAFNGRAVLPHGKPAVDKLYFKLLTTFWNETDWSEIFPSSPETAKDLYENRDIFLDYLEGFYSNVNVEDFANDFFEMTDVASINDFFKISFLDFYLLTWLRHFGIIDYNISGNSEVVSIMINNYGREIIKILS